MKKNFIQRLIIILLFAVSIHSFSQDIFSKTEIKVKFPKAKECVSIIDAQENIFVFFVGNNSIQYMKTAPNGETLFIKEFNYSTTISQKSTNNKRPQTSSLGYLVEGNYLTDDNKPTLVFSNPLRTKFFSIVFSNLGDEAPVLEKFEIKNKKEKHLTSITEKNKIFIYKYFKNSSLINVYEISKGIDKSTTLDFSNENFYNRDQKKCELSDILKIKRRKNPSNIMSFGQANFLGFNPLFNNHFNSNGYKKNNIKNENSLPSSIEISSQMIKTYAIGSHHIVTLNHRKSATRIISINSENKKFQVSHFNIPIIEFMDTNSNLGAVKSNSFIYKDKIYQLICSNRRLHLSAHDIQTKKLLKEYKYTKNDELTILNAPVTQKGGTYSFGSERTLKKTSQLLRKLTNAQNTGLFVFENNGKLILSIGGYSEIRTPGVGVPGVGTGLGGPITAGGFNTITNFSSPTFGAYNSYSYSKSIKANCLFDFETFEHVEGDIEKNIFDKASSNAERIKKTSFFKDLNLETIFKYKNFFIQGYYNRKDKEYIFYKFIN